MHFFGGIHRRPGIDRVRSRLRIRDEAFSHLCSRHLLRDGLDRVADLLRSLPAAPGGRR
jgi:hypothetical protein